MKELTETLKNPKLETLLNFFLDLSTVKRKGKAINKMLKNAEPDQKLIVPLPRLRCKIIGGGWNHPNNIGVVGRFLVGNYAKYDLEVGDLVLKTWNDLEKVFEILKIKQKNKGGEPEKGTAKIICTPFKIKYNEILLEHDRKIARGEILEHAFPLNGEAIDLIIDV